MSDEVSARGTGEAFSDAAVKAAGGVIAGVGALGFVALVGGAIFYAQMAALGLPADRIVEAMPRSTLLVVGARMLVPPMAGVGLWLALMCVLGQRFEKAARVIGIGGVVIAFLVFVLWNIAGPWWVYVVFAAMATALSGIVWFVGICAPGANEKRPQFRVFGAATAVAATLFAVAFGTALANLKPAARAVAIAWKGGPDIAGIYGASNPTEVVVGEVCEAKRGGLYRGSKPSGAIVVIPRSELTKMLIGTNEKLDSAIGADRELLGHLHGKPPPPHDRKTRSSTSQPRCTGVLPRRLKRVQHDTAPGIVQGP